MKKVLRIVLPLMVLVSAVVSCGRGGRVIPVRKMERIYREMLLADQWLAENPDKRGIADTTWFYEPIFEKYGFTLSDYQKSVDRYLNDPKRYAEMLGRVEKGLRNDLKVVNARIALEDRLQHEADSLAKVWKSVKAKTFNSFLDVFDVDAMTDRVGIEKDSLGVYRPVPVVEDTVFHGPCLVVRDTTVKESETGSGSLEKALDQVGDVMLEPVRDIAHEKPVRKLELAPAKDLLIRNE